MLNEKTLNGEGSVDPSVVIHSGLNPNKLLFNFDEVSTILGVSRSMVRKLSRTGGVQVVRIGKSFAYPDTK